LVVLQGGIESRFIPGLKDETKLQVEGSFKITGDKDLQKLALSSEQAIVKQPEDETLEEILNF
jgi:hypothetical protein